MIVPDCKSTCPYCNTQLMHDLDYEEYNCSKTIDHEFFYDLKSNMFALFINININKCIKIGKWNNKFHLELRMFPEIEEIIINPFEFTECKIVLDRYLKLKAFS